MKLHRTTHYQLDLFGLIPMVNVLVLVLAFAALSQNFMLSPGVSVALPASPYALGPQHNPQIISIAAGAVPTIYFQESRVTLEELARRLAAVPTEGERTLIIRADQAAPYEMVSQVMHLGLEHGYDVMMAAAPVAR
ncbi:MAG TPA: biopolymer transporter ExbD [Chthoniobacteraceae bacterium]|nr:biopolymer transporter ExbD [Chthoniobacteraceae bacterium]